MSIAEALSDALASVEVTGADGAAVQLAKTYADAVDAGEDLHRVGPLLLAVLVELGMTPKARAAVAKGGTSAQPASPLDELRERRRARQRHATTVDTAAT